MAVQRPGTDFARKCIRDGPPPPVDNRNRMIGLLPRQSSILEGAFTIINAKFELNRRESSGN